MLEEYYIACALPHSVQAGADFHMAVFFSPTIHTSSPTTLGKCALFRDWAHTVRSRLQVELVDQSGPIPCTALLEPVEPGLWRALFPRNTPVHSAAVPDWESRRWRSFDARQVHDIARALHLSTIVASAIGKPRLADLPLAEATARLLKAERRIDRSHRTIEAQRRPMPDEASLTEKFDKIVEKTESLERLERLSESIRAKGDWLERTALELHRCRRFYDRPEDRQQYRPRPDPKAKLPPLPKPGGEFHERCALVGDHRELMRRLGLVLELRVQDPQRLRQSKWLSARVAVDGSFAACRTTRVHCQAVDDALVASTDPQEPHPFWIDGALNLGDEERFSVLTLDTDGSALKMERYLWTLPRLLRAEENGDPVDGATPALRSAGFTIAAEAQAVAVRKSLKRQLTLEGKFDSGKVPDLYASDVFRGFRVEVWDEHARRWASLHRRLASAHVTGYGYVYRDLREQGFVQGTAAHESVRVRNSPIHVHEALFGWEGWSLSAPRPGLTLVHEGGQEKLREAPRIADDPPGKLVHPIRFEHSVEPGTLPRLRFGRTYAFRAWAVDLAGNSRPLAPGSETTPPNPGAGTAGSTPTGTGGTPSRSWLLDGLRESAAAAHARLLAASVAAEPSAGEDAAKLVLQHPTIGSEIADRLRSVRELWTEQPEQAQRISRRELVNGTLARAIANEGAELFASTAATVADGGINTALHPFLRWEPVPTPALVPRKRYTEGESLRVLAIRTGVKQNTNTLALTLMSPQQYAKWANKKADEAGYGPVSERHVAPPKGSQMLAELHGTFDLAIGSDSAARHRKMLGWALRDGGTFHDTTRADIHHPPARLPQKGIALVHTGMPTESLVSDLEKLNPGDRLAPGQTVIHDTDDLWLPYLPDPLARGISISFPEAGRDRGLGFPFGTECFTAQFSGDWPEIRPFRLMLRGGDELDGRVAGRKVEFAVPPGNSIRLRLASALSHGDLALLGVWRSLPASVTADPDVIRAATDGLLWGLTPYEEVHLVHAVNRPLEVPKPVRIIAAREKEGVTHAHLLGGVELHGPSTDSLVAEASWQDSIDDLSRNEHHVSSRSELAFKTRIRPYEDVALLSNADNEVALPSIGTFVIHEARHELHDTRHRVVRYRFRASTRFREYFAPPLLEPDPKDPLDDGVSVIGPEIEVSIPSSSRPAAPIVHSVIPLFRWHRASEPGQPMARRHVRRSGVRIYLERPWFSSGNDELLGVLLAPGGNDDFGPKLEDRTGFPFVSKWGRDPLWQSAEVANRAMPPLALDNFLHSSGFEDADATARPVTSARSLPLAAIDNSPVVTVLGYRPRYNKSRKLWFVDVAIDPGDAFWPFVRLAVCRYQPESIANCHLSTPVLFDFVQLPPERTTTVSRTDERHIRIVVSGPVGHREDAGPAADSVAELAEWVGRNRRLVALLQKRDPDIASDLGWQTVATSPLVLRGQGASAQQAAWVGELESEVPIVLARPEGGPGQWRVLVQEAERLQADPVPGRDSSGSAWEGRLIYADSFEL